MPSSVSVPVPTRTQQQRPASQAHPCALNLGAPGRIRALGHCYRRLQCTWGFCCRVWPLISCCGPQTQSQSGAPGPHLSVSVGSTPAPSSAHSARTLVHVHDHVHVHIRTALTTSFLFSFRVLVLVLVMGCWLIVRVRLPLLCPAALLPCSQHRTMRAWSGTGQPILSVPRPPPGRKSGSRTGPALHLKLATRPHRSPSARLCVKRL